MALGINKKAADGVTNLSKDLGRIERAEDKVIANLQVSKLIHKLSHKKEYISPALQMISKNSMMNAGLTNDYCETYGMITTGRKKDRKTCSLPQLQGSNSSSLNRSSQQNPVKK